MPLLSAYIAPIDYAPEQLTADLSGDIAGLAVNTVSLTPAGQPFEG